MSEHAFLPPSGAAAWRTCAAWPRMNQLYPEPEDAQDALEGAAAHWGGVELMLGRPFEAGMTAPNGVIVDDEMVESAQVYADHVHAMLKRRGLTIADAHIEQKIAINSIHPLNWGTPDVWMATPGKIDVIDFKHGHRRVEEFHNWQCADYVAGVIHELQKLHPQIHNWQVWIHIVQPRCYQASGPVRIWSTDSLSLAPLFEQLKAAALAASLPDAPATVNPECEFCPGRHACATLQRAAYDGAAHSFKSAPVELSNTAIGVELRILRRAAERLAARISGLEETALAKIQRGEQIPWFGIQHGQGRTVWAKPAAEIFTLGQLFGVDLAKPATAITPAQAIKAGVPAELVKPYTSTPRGAAKLVYDDGTQARKVFGHE